jgi:tetratricopeptide (TPR) repeat protein
MAMKQLGTVLLLAVCVVYVARCPQFALAQHSSVSVDWKAELEKARDGIKKNPKSAFWHNQAGVAYDALGDFERAVKELQMASTLDATDPIHDYALYAIYKRKGMLAQEREVLLKVLEVDSVNPLGRFEFAYVLEKEGHLADSLREYRIARQLAVDVKGPEYIDPRGNPYGTGSIRDEADSAIDRVSKLIASGQRAK